MSFTFFSNIGTITLFAWRFVWRSNESFVIFVRKKVY
jgi:hypothetical protein